MSILIVALILILYGTAISWTEERTNWFQELTSGAKQYINALLTFAVPSVIVILVRQAYPELRDASPLSQLLYISIPVVIWVASQIAHYYDPSLWTQCDCEPELEELPPDPLATMAFYRQGDKYYSGSLDARGFPTSDERG